MSTTGIEPVSIREYWQIDLSICAFNHCAMSTQPSLADIDAHYILMWFDCHHTFIYKLMY